VYSVNNQWQIDLINISKYSRWNAGFKYLFCGIDVFSRKSFVVAIKSKSDTTEAMRFVFANRKPILIQSDNGTEFLNNNFQQLLKQNGV
jgi:transposase InsO family protein